VKRDSYDAIVVGSGAGGGMSAYVLVHAGLKVLMLEAGRNYDPVSETPMFNLPSEAPLRAAGTPDKRHGYYDATIDGGIHMPNEPYTVAKGTEFQWWRTRMLGGRTNHWGRISLRFGPYDFKPYTRDGLGFDWPITYDDLAPWYDKVERLIGVVGGNEGLENVPDSPPGVLQPPPPPRASEYFLKRGFQSLGIPVAATRLAILTRPLNGRSACLYATDCMRGCAVRANFQSATVLIPPARDTGNLEIHANALVYQVDVDKAGHASGVSFVDRQSGQHHSVRAKAVVLAASACESARILLNSKSAQFPHGLANESGFVGRYLTDSVGSYTVGQFPALEKLAPRNDDGLSQPHIYVPWWGHQLQVQKTLNFPRGYHIEPYADRRRLPDMNIGENADSCTAAYGPELRNEMRRKFGTYFGFLGRGEMIPNDKSFVDLDPVVRDKWGIPVLRFHWEWSEHELRQATHMRQTFLAVIKRLGGKPVDGTDLQGSKAISPPGAAHEVGTTRMGLSARDSVVNQFGQSWSVKNLFVMDGGVFTSHPNKNPTLSILALSWRSSAYLVDEARKGNL
jgi:choline dehydrogenase-like flavoprotein